jgi:hypothetical protein
MVMATFLGLQADDGIWKTWEMSLKLMNGLGSSCWSHSFLVQFAMEQGQMHGTCLMVAVSLVMGSRAATVLALIIKATS